MRERREFGGEIVQDSDGGFWYTGPRRGLRTQVTLYPRISGYEGAYHGHAGWTRKGAEVFSPDDMRIADEFGKPMYLVTPSGRMLRYDPDPERKRQGPVTEIGRVQQ
jgi:hypothetical protein